MPRVVKMTVFLLVCNFCKTLHLRKIPTCISFLATCCRGWNVLGLSRLSQDEFFISLHRVCLFVRVESNINFHFIICCSPVVVAVFRNPNRDQCTMCCDTINLTACKFLAGSFTCQATCVLLCWQCHDEKTINLSRLSITKIRINSTNYHHVKFSKKWGKVIVFSFS